ncbi:uncharacterized protein LOC134180105 [Corticium candelabrum]|uniref:uncharacterized protein LOC134180105 n=1 Tax=Corticium candelabrum TaxID=121492 RepID=UPI002E2610C6|nr:uncharacterized protein LOC134180105 [Corticium candelabrum]
MDEQATLYGSRSQGSKTLCWYWKRVAVFCVVPVVLTVVSVAVAVTTILHNYDKSRKISELTPNSTILLPFNGGRVDQVTMESWNIDYNAFLALYTFPRKPKLTIYQKFSAKEDDTFLFDGQFLPVKFYLNKGSRMNVSFCSNGRVRLLVIQYDGYISDLHDATVRKNVKFAKTFDGQADDDNCTSPSKISFLCETSHAYQFVFLPWDNSRREVVPHRLTHIDFNGNLTQYNISTGANDHCHMSSSRTSCSVDLYREASTVVVAVVGNIDTDVGHGHIVTGMTIKSSVREDFIAVIIGGVIGCGVTLSLAILLVGYVWKSTFIKK